MNRMLPRPGPGTGAAPVRPAPPARPAAGPAGPASPARLRQALAAGARPLSVALLLMAMTLPVNFNLGGLRISPYRVVLIAMFLPAIFRWLAGRAGGVRAADLLVLGMSLWAVLGLMVLHGDQKAIEASGILVIETFGPYILARTAIRSPDSFAFFTRWLCIVTGFIGLFAAIESVTGHPLIVEVLSKAFQTRPYFPMEPRWGLQRAQGPFEHPILYGVFTAAGFGLALLALARPPGGLERRWSLIPLFATFWSLSSGAWLSAIVQGFATGWDRWMRWLPRRWLMLFLLFLAGVAVVELLSNRPVIYVLVSYLTFSTHNGYVRVTIWEYGLAEMMRQPVFGLGFQDWTWARPDWMPPSIDAFWVAIGVRHGFLAMMMLALAMVSVLVSLARAKVADPAAEACRRALLVCLAGLNVSILTVHLWGGTYALMMFLMGAGAWIRDWPGTGAGLAGPAPGPGRPGAPAGPPRRRTVL